MYNDCLNVYVVEMQKALDKVDPYFHEDDLIKIHLEAKQEAIEKVFLFENVQIPICFVAHIFEMSQDIINI